MNEEIESHLSGLSDADLVAAAKEARDNLSKAADSEPNSEWHQSCFAAVYVYAMELGKRGIKIQTVH